ncbi:MAG: hypothetical protein K9J16_08410 [Melioribacteraceae bacterium]|nr:hypothetical protein [Melioribacteraceae bacterium]MCF8353153.1 hypothetical protein [Melioribacteraceae bacterium]MCF8393147.1 hypothetical protein [Melioribacteraceae bacterium]MCF8418050.1 hypothetical protein [Melioribacteraceae bacterium]
MSRKKVLLSFILTVLLILITNSCERPTNPENANQSPNTTMANIPRENDTLFALVTLHWDGEDFDGFISGYQYRYITYYLTTGDSVVQDWKDTKETSLTIPFRSDDELNKQRFQVRSVDDKGTVDPAPAEKIFYTIQTIFPTTQILHPQNNRTYFVREEVSDWWPGIELEYSGFDQDGEIIEFGWTVDGRDTTWTTDTVVVITPDLLASPIEGEHTITVTSRDNTNLIDPFGKTITINLISPSLGDDILVIDATTESNFPGGLTTRPSDAVVDSFYAKIFPGSVQWDLGKDGFPPVPELGKYSLVVWHSDDLPSSEPHVIGEYTDQISDYLNVGGNIIIGGWRILKSFLWTEDFPISFPSSHFVNEYLHIVNVNETPLFGDFTGAAGLSGLYSDFEVDPDKLAGFPYFGKLGQINYITLPAGFTDGIYFYQNADDSPYYEYRGETVGLRYYGTSFQATILGFPMYFLKDEDAVIMAQEILSEMGIK